MIYRVVLFHPEPSTECDVRWFGSMQAVKLWADTMPSVVTTRYNIGRDVGRSWLMAVTTYDGRFKTRHGRFERRPIWTENIGPKVEIVPSVGELGYW